MLKKIVMLSLGLALANMSFASADTVKTKLSQQYPNIKISDIKPTEMKGLYSATLDDQVVYINEDAQHMFVGSMIRLKDKQNLTKGLVMSKNTIDFKKLPLQDAIKTVKGNGKRVIAVFSDPNCPYCKKLDTELASLNDVTIYTFLFPIKNQSVIPSKKVWCSPNKDYAWKNLIQSGTQPAAGSDCLTPIDRNLQLGRSLGIEGTPSIIFSNGFKVAGAYPAKEIEKIWKEFGL